MSHNFWVTRNVDENEGLERKKLSAAYRDKRAYEGTFRA